MSFGRSAPRLSQAVLVFGCVLAFPSLNGCSKSPTRSTAVLDTSITLEDLVAGPIDERDLVALESIVLSLSESERPSFQPALAPIDSRGLAASDLLVTYRRNYLAALDAENQASVWTTRPALTAACEQQGVRPVELAVIMTRVGCAHHASLSGSRLDVANARIDSEAKIATLLPLIDNAKDEMSRKALVKSLETLVAFEAYLRLLDLVPEANRQLVSKHRDRLSAILPPTPTIQVDPKGPENQIGVRDQGLPRR